MTKSNTLHSLKLSLILLGSFMISACSFAPEYVRPELDLPTEWSGYPNTAENINDQWWTRFNDPVLNSLIETALTNNYDLKIMAERVNQARAYAGVTHADLYPQAVGTSSVGRSQSTQQPYENVPPMLSFLVPAPTSSFSLGFQAAWELDFWGKYRNANSAALEQLLAAEYNHQALRLMMVAEVANAYFTLLSLDEQLAVSYRTLATREESLRIYTAQYSEGLINELDYLRASTEVDTVQTSIYALTYQIDNAETALQVLMGESPAQIFDTHVARGNTLTQINSAPQLPEGIPSELLARRPDILAAEASLRAANFEIGVAKAHWFPSISLTGALGLQSTELNQLFDGNAGLWSVGGGLTTPIFEAGRISSNIEISESAMREAALVYQQTVQTAFKEVRTALSVQENIGNVVHSLENIVRSLTSAVELAEIRYDNGYASYLEVLDAQRSLFEAEIQLAEARANQLSTVVNICRALGGGWAQY